MYYTVYTVSYAVNILYYMCIYEYSIMYINVSVNINCRYRAMTICILLYYNMTMISIVINKKNNNVNITTMLITYERCIYKYVQHKIYTIQHTIIAIVIIMTLRYAHLSATPHLATLGRSRFFTSTTTTTTRCTGRFLTRARFFIVSGRFSFDSTHSSGGRGGGRGFRECSKETKRVFRVYSMYK